VYPLYALWAAGQICDDSGTLVYPSLDIAPALVRAHHPAVFCAWCGKPVGVEAVVIATVVMYHLLCWERRA